MMEYYETIKIFDEEVTEANDSMLKYKKQNVKLHYLYMKILRNNDMLIVVTFGYMMGM